MKKILYIVSFFPILPTIALAQTYSAQSFITKFVTFANTKLITALLGIAFLFFIINVIRFFVIDGANEDGRENAKNLAIYGVLAFVVLIIFWGVVNLFANSLPFSGKSAPNPDYLQVNDKQLNSTPVRNPNTPTSQSGTAGPASNVQCPPGASFNASTNTCDYQ
jgi:succinate dehydrogenase/fumarate reductase cytochrome b subunit